MKIVFLDAKTIGDDIDLSAFEKLGEVVTYNFSMPGPFRYSCPQSRTEFLPDFCP